MTETHHDILSYVFDDKHANDKLIYIDAEDPNRSLSANQVEKLTRRVIAALQAENVKSGERVLVHLPNSIAVPAIIFGIIGAGAVYVGSNPLYKSTELEHLMSLAKPTLIITSKQLLSTVTTAATALQLSSRRVLLFDEHALLERMFKPAHESARHDSPAEEDDVHDPHGHRQLHDSMSDGELDWVRLSNPEASRATPAVMLSTSGTTGPPKLAILSHASILSNVEAVHQELPYDSTRLNVLPFFLFYGFICAVIPALKWRITHYMLPRFQVMQYVEAIEKHHITDILTAPVMLGSMLRSGLQLQNALRSLRFVSVGGSQLSGKVANVFASCLSNGARVFQCWGMTETGLITVTKWKDNEPSDSVGRVAKGMEIMLVDDEGQAVADGVSGEAWVRGSGMFDGYISSDNAANPMTADGWLKTGDLLTKRDGLYYFNGRRKDLIKVKGWSISPEELEGVLLTHPGIADAAVVGFTTVDGKTVPKAFVVLEPHAQLEAQDVYEWSRARLAAYKALDGGVSFVETLPRTASGKVQRFKLLECS